MFRVLVSRTFQRVFHAIPDPQQARIREALTQLEDESYTPRSKVDIHPLKDTHPQKYRLRWEITASSTRLKERKSGILRYFPGDTDIHGSDP